MKKHCKLQTLLREPLLHFLVIGAALFFIFAQLNDSDSEDEHRIVITQIDLNNLAVIWLRRTGRPPTAQEREQQLKHYIREQILYREAMNMGLDKGDVIVRRRLAKKMEYLFDDLSFVNDPGEDELNAYLSANIKKFTRPASISFKQIYLAPNQHKKNIEEDARKILAQLKTTTLTEAINLGDSSLLPYEFNHEKESEISGMFGAKFARKIFTLPVNSWQGPVISGYGTHLVYISKRNESRLPPIDEIRERVSRQWHETKQQEANKLFYQSLYQRYEIVLDDSVTENILNSNKK